MSDNSNQRVLGKKGGAHAMRHSVSGQAREAMERHRESRQRIDGVVNPDVTRAEEGHFFGAGRSRLDEEPAGHKGQDECCEETVTHEKILAVSWLG